MEVHDGTRTRNLPLRRRMPYPIGPRRRYIHSICISLSLKNIPRSLSCITPQQIAYLLLFWSIQAFALSRWHDITGTYDSKLFFFRLQYNTAKTYEIFKKILEFICTHFAIIFSVTSITTMYVVLLT